MLDVKTFLMQVQNYFQCFVVEGIDPGTFLSNISTLYFLKRVNLIL